MNTEEPDQNKQPSPPKQPNLRKVLSIVLGVLFLGIAVAYVWNFEIIREKVIPVSPVGNTQQFSGTVKIGAQLGEVKSYCSNGLYLVSDEGDYLVEQTTILQLRVSDKLLSDPKYINKKVRVTGKYPAQQFFCEALICGCDDYILVERIDIVDETTNGGASGIFGTVFLGPQCPGPARPEMEEECADQPSQGTFIVMTQDRERQVASFQWLDKKCKVMDNG